MRPGRRGGRRSSTPPRSTSRPRMERPASTRPAPCCGHSCVLRVQSRWWPTRPSPWPKSPPRARIATLRCGYWPRLTCSPTAWTRPAHCSPRRPPSPPQWATPTGSSSVKPSSHGSPWTAATGRKPPTATYLLPYHAVRLRLQLAKVYFATADLDTVHQLLREIDDIQAHRPALGTLVDEIRDFRSILTSSTVSKPAVTLPLSPAEIRLLPYLQTHLTTDKIAERLFLSRHTVKTELKSIYRKLGVSSRNDAVQTATAIGVVGT